MKALLVAVHDRATEQYHAPLAFQTEAQASRWFRNLLATTNEPMMKAAPDDFDLYHIGHYYDDEGRVEPLAEQEIRKIADGKTIAQTKGE